jgi:rubredoxin
MAAPGTPFNAISAVAETPENVSQTLVAATAADTAYTVSAAGTGSIILTRRYIPTWAIVVAIVGLFIALLGLLALLYKDTETLTITITPAAGGSRIAISGVATTEMSARITAAINAMPALEGADAEPSAAQPPTDELKTCPKCAESIKAAAVVCRFCGYEFSEPEPTASA